MKFDNLEEQSLESEINNKRYKLFDRIKI